MRLYGSDKEGCNLGAWFDPYECTYNLTSYVEQGYLSLFAKASEITLFCLGSLMSDPMYRLFTSTVAKMFDEVDEYLGLLGNPVGVHAYHPTYGYGEKNIHSYLGQCGVPMEMGLLYNEDSNCVFLAESAAQDKDIISKMKKTLLKGGDVIVTSGFLKAVGDAFLEFGNVSVTDKKAFVKNYCVSRNHGVNISGNYQGSERIIIPQLDYCTNDTWEIAGAYGNDNNFPIVLTWSYGKGVISVITIPDDMGDMYHYPKEVLLVIRNLFKKATGLVLDAPSNVQMFLYDGNYVIIRSDIPYEEEMSVILDNENTKLVNINTNHTLSADMERSSQSEAGKKNGSTVLLSAVPGYNQIYKIVK